MTRVSPLPGADELRVARRDASPAPVAPARPVPPVATALPVAEPARPPAPGRLRRLVRLGRRVVVGTLAAAHWASLGVASALALAIAAPMLFGAKPMMVRSGSMEPLIHTGDLVVVRATAPDAIEIGDVVTFRDPKNTGRLITHRVRDLEIAGERVTVTTKGDAVTGSETWTVPRAGTIGRVEYRIWKAGYAIAWVRTPGALLAAGALSALTVGMWVLVGIWRGT